MRLSPRQMTRGRVPPLADFLLFGVVASLTAGPPLVVIATQLRTADGQGWSLRQGLGAMLHLLTSAEFLHALLTTLTLGCVVTAFCLPIGVGLALLVGRTDIAGSKRWDGLITLPLSTSPFTLLVAWIALASPRTGFLNMARSAVAGGAFDIWSLSGLAFVLILALSPVVYLFTADALRGIGGAAEEAARMSGASPLYVLRHITLKLCAGMIAASGLLVFLLTIEFYTMPGLIGDEAGFTTLPWLAVQNATSAPPHPAQAASCAIILLGISALVCALQQRALRLARSHALPHSADTEAQRLKLGRLRPLAQAGLGGFVLLACLLPFLALLLSSLLRQSSVHLSISLLTAGHYLSLLTTPAMRAALLHTVLLAVITGLACAGLGLLIAQIEQRAARLTRLIAIMALLPLAIPGLVIGLGLQRAASETAWQGSLAVLAIAMIARFLPFGVLAGRFGLARLHPSHAEAARLSGASALTTLRLIHAPLLARSLTAGLLLVMLNTLRELAAAPLLAGPDSQTLAMLVWHHMQIGDEQFAGSLAVVQTGMMISIVLLARALARIRLDRRFGVGERG